VSWLVASLILIHIAVKKNFQFLFYWLCGVKFMLGCVPRKQIRSWWTIDSGFSDQLSFRLLIQLCQKKLWPNFLFGFVLKCGFVICETDSEYKYSNFVWFLPVMWKFSCHLQYLSMESHSIVLLSVLLFGIHDCFFSFWFVQQWFIDHLSCVDFNKHLLM